MGSSDKSSRKHRACPGDSTTTAYNTQGKISSVTESGYTLVSGVATPKTSTTSYQYNASGQLTEINGPRIDVNDITTYTYYPITDPILNNRGQLHTITNALNQTTTYAGYDANGNVGSITDINNVVTLLTYDERNRLKTVTNQSTTALTRYFYNTRQPLLHHPP